MGGWVSISLIPRLPGQGDNLEALSSTGQSLFYSFGWGRAGMLLCTICCSKTYRTLKQSFWYVLQCKFSFILFLFFFSNGKFAGFQSVRQFCLVGTSAGMAV